MAMIRPRDYRYSYNNESFPHLPSLSDFVGKYTFLNNGCRDFRQYDYFQYVLIASRSILTFIVNTRNMTAFCRRGNIAMSIHAATRPVEHEKAAAELRTDRPAKIGRKSAYAPNVTQRARSVSSESAPEIKSFRSLSFPSNAPVILS